MEAKAGKGKTTEKGAGRKEQVRTSTPAKDLQYITVPTDSIVVGTFNPRHTFDETRMEELTASVRAKGVLEPLLVRLLAKPKGKARYELIAGERRWRAAQRAGRATVPVGVGDFTDQEALEIAVIENEQRADVPILEKAEGYQR
ncbi:MAG TPA: ParB/RepB/Spo0J family partition protein, partial [Pyrinomonadaceae bacterium]